MTEKDYNQSITFTDINGRTGVIKGQSENSDNRVRLSIDIGEKTKVVDNDDSKEIKTVLEYHVELLNSYYSVVEKTAIISREEFGRLLALLEFQADSEKTDKNADADIEQSMTNDAVNHEHEVLDTCVDPAMIKNQENVDVEDKPASLEKTEDKKTKDKKTKDKKTKEKATKKTVKTTKKK